ncbi:glutaredoxin family protein [Bacillus sp. Marseille-Q1617]|uniref:glutaredoxin family protein n=1 Tax=Bacillus sp. Marseille-Q1617 TaxID=2736887 RepID=UPI00158D8CFA|nr:glutaredoxin family protein [Bacillus sp. Marseille-Q1617]
MNKELILELYTRPTCSDCQAAKEYLAEHDIDYVHKNVGEDAMLEKELIDIAGSRIVPSFVFYKKGLLGKKKFVKNLIGFENNREEIEKLLG